MVKTVRPSPLPPVDNSVRRTGRPATVPAMSFVIGSYQAIEHPGAGHRAGPTSLWRGEDLRSGDEVAMTLLPADSAEAARAAVATVGVIRHPHLLPVIEVVVGEVATTTSGWPWCARGRRPDGWPSWSPAVAGSPPAETLTVLIPLADALAAAHAGGIRHGDVCPESIWFDGQGRPLLGALAVSAVVADLNDGLPAGSRDVAPEVVRGEAVRRGPVTRAADVFSLGSVALCCLTGRSAWPADDAADVLVQSAAGVWPDLPDDAGPAPLVATGPGDAAGRTRAPAECRQRRGRVEPDSRRLADRFRIGSGPCAGVRGSLAGMERRAARRDAAGGGGNARRVASRGSAGCAADCGGAVCGGAVCCSAECCAAGCRTAGRGGAGARRAGGRTRRGRAARRRGRRRSAPTCQPAGPHRHRAARRPADHRHRRSGRAVVDRPGTIRCRRPASRVTRPRVRWLRRRRPRLAGRDRRPGRRPGSRPGRGRPRVAGRRVCPDVPGGARGPADHRSAGRSGPAGGGRAARDRQRDAS